MVARVQRKEGMDSFLVDGVSVLQDESILDTDGGDGLLHTVNVLIATDLYT